MRALFAVLFLLLPVQLAGLAAGGHNRGGGLADQAPALEMTVTITEDTVEAAPSESAPGTAQLHGTVTVQMPSLRGASVTLTSSTDIGWVSQVSPSTFVLDNGQVGEFSITVVVPQGTPASQNGNVIVNGRAVASGLQALDSDTSIINVKAYFRFALEAQRREVEISPGATARFSLRVTNAGNSVDSFELRFTNQKELERQGWMLSAPNTSLDKIVPGEYRTLTIALAAPVSISPYRNQATTLNIRVASLGGREQNITTAVDYPLTVKEVGASGPGLGVAALVAVVVAVVAVFYWRRRRREKAEETPDEPSLSSEESA